MKKINIFDFNPYVPGFAIDKDGSIYAMEEENHATFFSNIIGKEIMKLTGGIGKDTLTESGISTSDLRIMAKSKNLEELTKVLLKQFNYLVYLGCTSGNREFNGGLLYVNDLTQLSNEQLKAIIYAYSMISEKYNMQIIKACNEKENESDEFINPDQVYRELESRKNIDKSK